MTRLVSRVEIADMLGVSRQRLHQILREWADFPKPIATLGIGQIWDRAQVEGWMREHGRVHEEDDLDV